MKITWQEFFEKNKDAKLCLYKSNDVVSLEELYQMFKERFRDESDFEKEGVWHD